MRGGHGGPESIQVERPALRVRQAHGHGDRHGARQPRLGHVHVEHGLQHQHLVAGAVQGEREDVERLRRARGHDHVGAVHPQVHANGVPEAGQSRRGRVLVAHTDRPPRRLQQESGRGVGGKALPQVHRPVLDREAAHLREHALGGRPGTRQQFRHGGSLTHTARSVEDGADRRPILSLVPPFLRGLTLGLSLIVAIGPQNAFVLRQGLTRRHALLAAVVCSLADTALIAFGALGVGALLSQSPALVVVGTLAGAAFLGWYGWRSFRSARNPGTLQTEGQAAQTPAAVLATAAAFSLLNPHALLDTVVLIGGASAGLSGRGRTAFLLGTVLASWTWFFALALLAGRLAPLMRSPSAWQVLDVLIGVMMWAIAAGLVGNVFSGG